MMILVHLPVDYLYTYLIVLSEHRQIVWQIFHAVGKAYVILK